MHVVSQGQNHRVGERRIAGVAQRPVVAGRSMSKGPIAPLAH